MSYAAENTITVVPAATSFIISLDGTACPNQTIEMRPGDVRSFGLICKPDNCCGLAAEWSSSD